MARSFIFKFLSFAIRQPHHMVDYRHHFAFIILNEWALRFMFFLVTGASGVGKSTVRRLIEPVFAEVLEAAELAMLGDTPKWNIAWRHQMVERMVRRALDVQRGGKHFLFCGDPVPPGEIWAAPSADQLDRLAVCLLDASEKVQTARLVGRGDDSNLIHHHVAFADWMRHHVLDHRHRPEVITQNAWPEMRWDRWVGIAAMQPPWNSHVIDTSDQSPADVTHLVGQWLHRHIHANKTGAANGSQPFRSLSDRGGTFQISPGGRRLSFHRVARTQHVSSSTRVEKTVKGAADDGVADFTAAGVRPVNA